MCIYRIRDGFYPLTGKKSAELCLGSQPAAAGYERNASGTIYLLFFLPDTSREIILASSLGQVLTVAASVIIMMTPQGEVTDGRSWPDVVHGPDHWLATVHDFPDTFQRQHSLVDPMEMNHVSLLEFRKGSDIISCIGYIKGKEILFGKMQMPENAPALPKETPL